MTLQTCHVYSFYLLKVLKRHTTSFYLLAVNLFLLAMHSTRAPIAVFFTQICFFFSPCGCLGLILKNLIKSRFFEDNKFGNDL